jgi:hypothetical protein
MVLARASGPNKSSAAISRQAFVGRSLPSPKLNLTLMEKLRFDSNQEKDQG